MILIVTWAAMASLGYSNRGCLSLSDERANICARNGILTDTGITDTRKRDRSHHLTSLAEEGIVLLNHYGENIRTCMIILFFCIFFVIIIFCLVLYFVTLLPLPSTTHTQSRPIYHQHTTTTPNCQKIARS